MILESLLNLIYSIFDKLMILNIPDMPAEVQNYIDTMFSYLVAGAGILANYTPLSYLMILFGILLAVDMGIMLYHLVMWILKKIPVLGIE